MKKLITSALPYVNNVPHLGNLIQVLSADVFARFCRLRGYETLYVCGTDEYGTATETKAQLEKVSPRQLCDRFHALHAQNYNWFEIAFDYFGRTSDEMHTGTTQKMFLSLEKNGYITEQESEQLYCDTCSRFLADRYVAGTCPHCGYEDARGDQCEHCGALLEPTELVNPRCSTCGGVPHPKKTKHLYINLPAIVPLYEKWMAEASVRGKWSNNAIRMTKSWLRDGLKQRAITRDLSWGIKVPRAGYEHKVFYVWFDAPIGYISLTEKWAALNGCDWKDWWYNNDDVQLFQFIGKDNIPFHTVIFPSTLLGSGEPWTKLYHMSSTEYLNYETGKFSKSKGIGVFGTDAQESGIPADVWRFYIFYNRPEKSDTTFTWNDFQDKVNSELIGNLCNLVNRSLSFVLRYCNGNIVPVDTYEPAPDAADPIDKAVYTLRTELQTAQKKVVDSLEWANLKDAFQTLFRLSSVANKLFQELEPWKTIKTNPNDTEIFLSELCYFIKDLMIMFHPYIPAYCDQVADFLGVKIWSGNIFNEAEPVSKREHSGLRWSDIGTRTGLNKVLENKIIFKTFDNDEIAKFRKRYGGMQNEGQKNIKSASDKKPAETKKTEVPKDPRGGLSAVEFFNKNIALKVAKIIAIEKHPDADKLYVEKLDDGSGNERTIISGLVPFYTADQLLGKHVIIADNLAPRKMRGIVSCGMLLAADCEAADGSEIVEVLSVPDAQPGTPVVLQGSEGVQDKPDQINADQFFAVDMKVTDAVFNLDGVPFTVGGSTITSETVKNGSVG